MMKPPNLRFADDEETQDWWEKRLRVRGMGEFMLRVWYGPFPHESDWELRSVDGVLIARCPCVKTGHRDPEQAARRCVREGLPLVCRLCIERESRDWCELWRVRTGGSERIVNAGKVADTRESER